MYEMLKPTIEHQPGEHLSWRRVWFSALTKPSVATFERILSDPEAGWLRGILWLYISVAIVIVVPRVIVWFGHNRAALATLASLSIFIVVPVVALLWLPFFALEAGVVQLIAGRVFHGSGDFSSLLYAFAAFQAPLLLIRTVIFLIPSADYLAYIIWGYEIVLGIIAVRAVNRIGWFGAFISYLILVVPWIDIIFQDYFPGFGA